MSKNKAGKNYYNWLMNMDKLVRTIDRRTENGEDRENVDHVWQQHTINENGDRVWSF